MSADPVAWVGKRLADMHGLLEEAGVDVVDLGDSASADIAALQDAAPDVVAVLHRMLAGVREGRLAQPPAGVPADELVGARLSWL